MCKIASYIAPEHTNVQWLLFPTNPTTRCHRTWRLTSGINN
jgi:hypothetical protein